MGPCLYGRACRVRALTDRDDHHPDVTWCWVLAPVTNARVAVAGSPPSDWCRCLAEYGTLLAQEIVAPEDIERVGRVLTLAFGHREIVVELASSERPDWILPARN